MRWGWLLAVVLLCAGWSKGEQEAATVSVIIPCIPRDIDTLEHRTLPSLAQQTVIPMEVIVAISEMTQAEADRKAADWKGLLPEHVKVKVLADIEKHMPGVNRNRAMPHATGDIVSFFDADDEMHPRRLEAIHRVFTEQNASCVVHSFVVATEKDAHREDELISDQQWEHAVAHPEVVVESVSELAQRWGTFMESLSRGEKFYPLEHHGHASVTRKIIEDTSLRFADRPRNEDTMYINSIHSKGHVVMFIPLPLTVYYPSGSDVMFRSLLGAWDGLQHYLTQNTTADAPTALTSSDTVGNFTNTSTLTHAEPIGL